MVKVLVAAAFVVLVMLISAQASAAFSFTKTTGPVDGVVDFELSVPDIALERINFGLPDQGGKFTFYIEKIETGEEWVYEEFFVDAIGLRGNPESIIFDIKVRKSWIEENDIETSTIALNIYDEAWERIELLQFSEDEDFVHYRASVPELEAIFAVTGEPVPFEIKVTKHCNGNGVCETELGEDSENCRDCLRRVSGNVCIPSQKTCLGDDVLICSRDGRDYTTEECDVTCSDGECVAVAGIPTAGMAVASNPFFLVVVALLSSVIAYLAFTLRRMKETLNRVEKIASSHDNINALTERRDED